MGAPIPEMEPVENASAEALLSSLKTIRAADRRQHASVFNYWLSIRRGRDFPPIRDLDPLEISDAGPWSILLEMIGGGEDANVRHFGQAIKGDLEVEKVAEAPNPSLLSCFNSKLPIVAACREAFAFEEEYEGKDGTTRCWVTLLPFSANGSWIDYVYGYVSLDPAPGAEVEAEPEPEEVAEAVEEEAPEAAEDEAVEAAAEPVAVEPEPEEPEPFTVPLGPLDGSDVEMAAPIEAAPEAYQEEPEPEPAAIAEPVAPSDEPEPETASDHKPGFSKFLGGLAKMVQPTPAAETEEPVDAPAEPVSEEQVETATEAEPEAAIEDPVEEIAEPVAEFTPDEPEAEPVETIAEPACEVEGTLQSKLTDVRALAEEAREAQIRSNMALYEGLSAAYDFALDAEDAPEEYLRLVEAQGLKIQLRSPMKPVVKLAFDGMCDEPTIKQLEAVLAWALKQDLPRGTLSERIQAEGGLGPILNNKAA